MLVKVPGCFALLGAVFVGVQLVGLLIISEPYEASEPERKTVNDYDDEIVVVESDTESTGLLSSVKVNSLGVA